jgi:glycosyltransferase involved in cell wall biosynthesis
VPPSERAAAIELAPFSSDWQTDRTRMTETSRVPRLSVVIPVYNERGTIGEVLRRVQAVAIEKEIVVVDDGSTDGTREFLHRVCGDPGQDQRAALLPEDPSLSTENIRVFFQEKNSGKGAALRRGFKEARGQIVIIQDADLEVDPQDYHKLLEPIERGTADVVYGSRFLGGPHPGVDYWHVLVNKWLTMLSNMFTKLNLTDVWTCYKVFPRELLYKIDIKEDRFGFEPEVTAKVAKQHWRVSEVPIYYQSRGYAEGKKIGWKDGIKGVWCTLRYGLFD